MKVQTFFEQASCTLTHILYDESTKDAVIIDPVLDLDTVGWETHTTTLDMMNDFVQENQLKIHYAIDTHIHADHLTGFQYCKEHYQAKLVVNDQISLVQKTFVNLLNMSDKTPVNGEQFDVLVKDGDQLKAGSLTIDVLHTPGHTPACTSFKVDNVVFTGDALFVPDIGTGRCDFPNGSAEDLFDAITSKLYTLSDDTLIYPGHDYPGDKEPRFNTTIGDSKASNVDLPGSRSKEDYVAFINKRDATLPLPRLIYQGVQINLGAGTLPIADDNGTSYLKIPIKAR
jgi:glyoxylase-like metal-dependent hydrolase (beta-lactamase superfamily II)